ncbi:MAG: VWA domain-containing protein [Acidobacteria bacterium]|nr:VWA domain-containing protein [Acidobacteriota bacterium]
MTSGWGLLAPWWLVLLALLPLHALLRLRSARDAVDLAPLQHAPPGLGRRWRWAAGVLLPVEVVLLALVVVALAGPYRESRRTVVEDPGVDLVLVLDVSLSMLAEDFPPNRLEVLRRLAGELLTRSGGNRVGLVIFARDTYVQSPLTTDRRALRSLLEGVQVYAVNTHRSGGTALGDALLVAADQLRRVRVAGRDQALVLITDGESNEGLDPLLAARFVRQLPARLYALGVGGERPVEVLFEGRPVGAPDAPFRTSFDDGQLRRLAEVAGGRYFRATDVGALEAIFDELSRLEHAPLETRTVILRRSLRGWLALATFGLFALALLVEGGLLRRPWR